MFAFDLGHESCPLYGVAGCPLFRGCLSIGVNGRTVVTFRIVRYIVAVGMHVLKQASTVSSNSTYVVIRISPKLHCSLITFVWPSFSPEDYMLSCH